MVTGLPAGIDNIPIGIDKSKPGENVHLTFPL